MAVVLYVNSERGSDRILENSSAYRIAKQVIAVLATVTIVMQGVLLMSFLEENKEKNILARELTIYAGSSIVLLLAVTNLCGLRQTMLQKVVFVCTSLMGSTAAFMLHVQSHRFRVITAGVYPS